ncbi:DUF1631 family protein [Thiolapillus sp.]|uniref:DUF1631 family protein n=1 Tax=Thiolapillus sp. TaxID=2017437 RepID=UPI003AF951AE
MTLFQKQQLHIEFSAQLRYWIDSHLDGFFEQLDEEFFSLAESAVNDLAQRSYIDAIRELRQNREVLSSNYRARVLLATEKFFLDYRSYQQEFLRTQVRIGQDQNSMELINQDVLEEDLAVMRVAHHAENRHLSRLKELSALLARVTPTQTLKRNEVPVSPGVLANALQYVLQEWSGDLQTKLSFYEVFGKHCLDRLEKLYPDLISLLEKAGLKPVENLLQKPAQARQQQQEQRRTGTSGEAPRRFGQMDEGTLFGVVALVRQLEDEQRESLGLPSQSIADFPEDWPVASVETIANVIGILQSELSMNPPRDIRQARVTQNALKGQLVSELGKTVTDQKVRLQRIDQHIIDVVNMLFEYILDDPIIPAQMKVLLVRLQMPVLRISLEDKSFLTDRSHPVRDLLNNLAAAAARWSDEGDYAENSIYGRIEQAVQRILNDSTAGVDLWIEVNEDFETYVLNEERGASVAEERLSQVAKGKERLSQARQAVDEYLTRLLPAAVPAPVYQIVDEVWRDVMTLILLREGEGSNEWNKAVRVLERLIDSIIPRADPEERQIQMAKIPLLLADLRRGFASISYDSGRAAMMFKQLQQCHVTTLRGLQPATMKYQPHEKAGMEGGSLEAILSDEFMQQASELKQGQWITWTTGAGKELRGKLSWRSEVTDLMLFVDLRGRRVAEMSSSELADLLRSGRASLLTSIDRPIIERALAAIYNTLTRQMPGHVLPA